MRIKSHRLLCFLLVIMVSLSGMCFIDDRTDSLPACAHAQIIRTNVIPLQATEQSHHQSGESGFFPDILCPEFFVWRSGYFFIGSELIQFYIQYPNKSIINYIHQSDGKKRIYSFW